MKGQVKAEKLILFQNKVQEITKEVGLTQC